MFHDDTGGGRKAAYAEPCRIGVGQVVKRELFALELGVARQPSGRCRVVTIEGSSLVRVLAITQGLGLRHLKREDPRQGACRMGLLRHNRIDGGVDGACRYLGQSMKEIGNRRIVGRRVGEGLGCELLAQRPGQAALLGLEFFKHRGIVSGVDNHGHPIVILRRGTDHRGPPNIDVFNDLLVPRRGPGQGLSKGVEVDHHQIDGGNSRGRKGLHMGWEVAPSQQSAMHGRMQGLDPAIEHLGKSRDRIDQRDRQPSVGQELGGTPGRDQSNAPLMQALGKGQEPVFV